MLRRVGDMEGESRTVQSPMSMMQVSIRAENAISVERSVTHMRLDFVHKSLRIRLHTVVSFARTVGDIGFFRRPDTYRCLLIDVDANKKKLHCAKRVYECDEGHTRRGDYKTSTSR